MTAPPGPPDAALLADVQRIAALGPRFCGSEGERRARSLLSAQFAAAGLRSVRQEPVEVLGYDPGEAGCRTVSGAALPCTGLQYTASAQAVGKAVDLGDATADEIAAAQAAGIDLAGRVAVVRGLPFAAGRRLAPHRIAALVHIADTAGDLPAHFTAAFWPPSFDGRVTAFPGVSVTAGAGRRLRDALAGGPVRLTVAHRAGYPRVTTANVLGELPGTDPDAAAVVIGAHYDTQRASPGASDNATGLAALLGIARAWRRARPRRMITFVAFAAEELGAWGATAFAATRNPETIRAVINLDALGPPMEATRMLVTTPGLAALARAAAGEAGWIVEQEVDAASFPYTDNAPFAAAGVETCLLWRLGPPHPYYHSAGDVPAQVDAVRLGEDARAAAAVAWRLATEGHGQSVTSKP